MQPARNIPKMGIHAAMNRRFEFLPFLCMATPLNIRPVFWGIVSKNSKKKTPSTLRAHVLKERVKRRNLIIKPLRVRSCGYADHDAYQGVLKQNLVYNAYKSYLLATQSRSLSNE